MPDRGELATHCASEIALMPWRGIRLLSMRSKA